VAKTDRMVNSSPFFYGWVVLVAGTLGMIMSSPGQTYVISMFVDHFITELSIDRTTVSALYTGATLAGSFALPKVGRYIDRQGSRKAVVAITLLFGLACFAMSRVAGVVSLALGFVAMRMMGQGSMTLVSANVINQWWVRRRGTVMGLSGMAAALLGTGLFPPLVNRLISTLGWRSAFVVLGLTLLLVMLPLGWLLFRDTPELYGLQPDGQSPSDEDSTEGPPQKGWSLEEARRTSIFWIVSAGLACIAMLITALHFHVVSIFEDNGLQRSVAADIFFPIAATTSLVTLASGILKDRVPVKYLMAAALVSMGSSVLLATHLHTFQIALCYGLCLGITSGLFRTVSGVVWADMFGRTHLGAISGLATTLMIVGSALGPLPLGYARDLMGGYTMALAVSSLLPFALAVLTLFCRKPIRDKDS
jgi:MFS family permease